MNRQSCIGFDRRIDLEWLDASANRAAAETAPDEFRAFVWELLDGVVSGDNRNGARGKTVTVLSHIWGPVSDNAASLRHRAGIQVLSCTPDERLALHWAMMVATYPIFTDVAVLVGRLLTLRGSFALAHLTRRLVGVWGERSTLSRAAQRIVRSMIQWGVLRDTATPGMYEAVPGRKAIGPVVSALLIEALLMDAEATAILLEQLIRHSALFPFDLIINARDIRSAPQFCVHREGLDFDFVELRNVERSKKG